MIRVESIAIKNFRGIRDLTLDFHGKSFAICGANGTGKSGVVDALEFGLTGNVSRLSGEGRGEVSLKEHGPHVDVRDDPGQAQVTVSMTILDLDKKVTVERNLKSPGKARINLKDAAVIDTLRQIEAHPEIVLSRRELIRYVLSTPGKRSEEVQALLQLDKVEQLRTALQKIANSCQRKETSLRDELTQAQSNLLRVLGIEELESDRILSVVNEHRRILSLPPITKYSSSTSFDVGFATSATAEPQRIAKNQALVDIQETRQSIEELSSSSTIDRATQLADELTDLRKDPEFEQSLTWESFYNNGMELIGEAVCPFCDTPWNVERLKRHVQAKLDRLAELSQRREAAETELRPFITAIRRVQAAVNAVDDYATRIVPPVNNDELRGYSTSTETAIHNLTSFLPLSDSIEVLRSITKVPEAVLAVVEELEKAVVALPEPSYQDSAISWLAVAQERLERLRDAESKHVVAKAQAETAQEVFEIYIKTSDTFLTNIYKAVEEDFVSLYRFLHRDDEGNFDAQLLPSTGKLGFDVDFYGRGSFPPGAYHSEGHQDCMGLCLYLALMRHLEGDTFTLAILDDVLMSVDVGHRREVCSLLKGQFPNTQFVMTTHDPIWLKHMRTEGLIQGCSAVQFRKWNLDHGPLQWDDKDVWAEIASHLERGDVRSASALLRSFLEYMGAELCHRLRAPVEFRGDSRYQLGELMPAAVSRLRKLYSLAKDAANSWDRREEVNMIADRSSAFGKLVEKSNVEQWQMNAAIHYNSWENLTKDDFAPVVEAFRDLLSGFSCPDCNHYFRVTPDRETIESLTCDCGGSSINLKKKRT